jgi:hypothetical protein
MKGKEGLQTVNKATASVGALLLLLALNLAFGNPLFNLFFGSAVSAGTRPTPPATVVPSKEKIGKTSAQNSSRSNAAHATRDTDRFARYDPSLNLDALKDLVSRPIPNLGRNPFELESTPQSKASADQPPPVQPPPPPPPPPIMLKVVGSSEKPGGTNEAYVCETRADGSCSDDKEVYVVHEGEEFGNHFKAIKITSHEMQVEDLSSHQTTQLPIAQ